MHNGTLVQRRAINVPMRSAATSQFASNAARVSSKRKRGLFYWPPIRMGEMHERFSKNKGTSNDCRSIYARKSPGIQPQQAAIRRQNARKSAGSGQGPDKVSPLAWACARSDADRSNRLGGDHAYVPLSAQYLPRVLFAPIIFRPCRHGSIICRIGPRSLRKRTIRPRQPTPAFPPGLGSRNPKST